MIERDPVCLKNVETDRAASHERYKARDFYFCSPKCQECFEQDPDTFYRIAELSIQR